MSSITSWPNEERPRERLLKHGASALSDAELLAIFLRTGIKGKNAIELAREIIQHFGGIKGMLAADLEQFCQLKGLGNAKYVQLHACIEMSQRYLAEELAEKDAIQNPAQVKSYVQSKLVSKKNEIFVGLFLDNQHRIIRYEELFSGTINASSVHPRVLVQKSLEFNAAALIVAHNHPSGVAEPSVSDIQITQTIKSALQLIDVRLLDHLIVASHQVISLAELGQV
ncbi:MAG: DNA repair protein RadC [Kangiellaceae bacterium]|nr:DNA repair protein RadC [Kangiellaceae bacterium]MCW8999439.1 DNA repair protein RadC [Kangiellaceae bacterium]MCW9016390.1 DNA repair protein RadC [Kangiellaceae bacterium]